MSATVHGYAENEADIVALCFFAGVDIIVENLVERGPCRRFRR